MVLHVPRLSLMSSPHITSETGYVAITSHLGFGNNLVFNEITIHSSIGSSLETVVKGMS
jgi:hypothetical protein